MTSATDLISAEYREWIETANLDFQVAEYVRHERRQHEASGFEIKAAAVREIAIAQHGQDVFDTAVENY